MINKNILVIPTFGLCLLLNSCSWVTSKRSLFGDGEGKEVKESAPATVPKEQFDELSKKYEALLRERSLENISEDTANTMMNQMEKKYSEDVVSELKKAPTTSELAETVDVFSKNHYPSNEVQDVQQIENNMLANQTSYDGAMIEDQIKKIRKVEELVGQNRFDASLNIIKELEKSPIKQIVVRAKYWLGEILFKQGEYDLSMQIFEEILEKHAFSGLVIKSLGRLIVCSEKLKIRAKQEKYYSILHDFFEQGA